VDASSTVGDNAIAGSKEGSHRLAMVSDEVPASCDSPVRARPPTRPLARWLLEDRVEDIQRHESRETTGDQHLWWRVMWLTGVDYDVADPDRASGLDSTSHVPRSLVVHPGGVAPEAPQPRHRYADTVVYEVHVKGSRWPTQAADCDAGHHGRGAARGRREVLLDVVFTHTAEGDHLGPTLCTVA
jgi:hypothetical protein